MTDKKLVVYEPRNIIELRELSSHLASSQYFDNAKEMTQALVKIKLGQEMGIGAVTAMMNIEIIEGKPTVKPVLMAAKIREHPLYDYNVIEHSDTVCSIQFYYDGEECGISTFTMDDAKQANLLQGKKGPKANWQRYPRNMLWARAMSNGAKWYCPDVFMGVSYVPEEMGVEVDEDGWVVEGDVVEDGPPYYGIPQSRPSLVTAVMDTFHLNEVTATIGLENAYKANEITEWMADDVIVKYLLARTEAKEAEDNALPADREIEEAANSGDDEVLDQSRLPWFKRHHLIDALVNGDNPLCQHSKHAIKVLNFLEEEGAADQAWPNTNAYEAVKLYRQKRDNGDIADWVLPVARKLFLASVEESHGLNPDDALTALGIETWLDVDFSKAEAMVRIEEFLGEEK